MLFDKIIGHSNIKQQIKNSIKESRFSHAHMILGEDGIGKSVIGKSLAFSILGKEKEALVDIYEFRVQNNKKSIGVDEIRSLIIEVNKKPYEGDKKVIIIYQGDKMTEQAQNAFLKTIEEPPKGVYIIVLCENGELVLDTIKSRCQIYKLNRLKDKEMLLFIRRKYPEFSDKDIKAVVAVSDGIPGRAEKFIEDDKLKEIRNCTLEILLNLKAKNIEEILRYEDFLMKFKDEWKESLTWFLCYIRDVLVYKETGKEAMIINGDKENQIKEITEIFSYSQLNDIILIVTDTKEKLERNVNTALVFDTMLVKMQEV